MEKMPTHIFVPTVGAHAVLGTLAWGLVLPLGAILFALNRYPSTSALRPKFRTFWVHTPIQVLGICMALANFGLGIYIGISYKKLYNLGNPHTYIGTIVTGLMLLQPFLGTIHHAVAGSKNSSRRESTDGQLGDPEKDEVGTESQAGTDSNAPSYVKANEGAKTWSVWGLAHRWIGRVTITLAMMNGGFGFWLSKSYRPVWSFGGQVAYSVMVGLMFVVWMSVIFGGWLLRRRSSA